jgi:hypothetical protein
MEIHCQILLVLKIQTEQPECAYLHVLRASATRRTLVKALNTKAVSSQYTIEPGQTS